MARAMHLHNRFNHAIISAMTGMMDISAVWLEWTMMTLLIMAAFAAVTVRDLLSSVVFLSFFSIIMAVLYVLFDAPDVALTEASVGAGISTVLFLGALSHSSASLGKRKWFFYIPAIIAVSAIAITLIQPLLTLPAYGDPQAPHQQHLAPYYIQHMKEDIGIPNLVTAILGSYRGFDTLGETAVIFLAAMAVVGVLKTHFHTKQRYDTHTLRHMIVAREVSHLLLPFILIFAFYVQFHGEISPGGGFQAGILFASGFILYGLLHGGHRLRRIFPYWLVTRMAALGVFLYAGTGAVTMLLGGKLLEYNVLATGHTGQHLGLWLIEAGVCITVCGAMLLVYYAFSSYSSAVEEPKEKAPQKMMEKIEETNAEEGNL